MNYLWCKILKDLLHNECLREYHINYLHIRCFHFYYLADKTKQFKGKVIPGIDIKHKGYVVLPPSIHPNGTVYEVINNVDPVALPAELEKLDKHNSETLFDEDMISLDEIIENELTLDWEEAE